MTFGFFPLLGVASLSLLSLRSPFTLSVIAFLAASYFAVRRFFGSAVALVAVSLSTVATWTAVFTSTVPLPRTEPLDINAPIATGGWPFPAFRYPVPPMGSDVPPLEQWPLFFVNHAIFVFVALLVAVPLGRSAERLGANGRAFRIGLGVLAAGTLLFGSVFMVMKFD